MLPAHRSRAAKTSRSAAGASGIPEIGNKGRQTPPRWQFAAMVFENTAANCHLGGKGGGEGRRR